MASAAQPQSTDDQTTDEQVMLMPAELTGAETLVGEHGGRTAITGEIRSSWSTPGFHLVQTEFGTLLLDSDLPVAVARD